MPSRDAYLRVMAATTLADRALLRISGDDPRGFLQGLVTADLDEVVPGQPRWSGLLTAQGKVLFDFLLWDDAESSSGAILIDCEADRAEALARRLALYRLRRAITLDPVAELAVHWSLDAADRPRDPRLPALGTRWLAPPGEPAQGWLAHRLSLGVTEGLAELGDGSILWLEANARELGGVSFTKGCFIGQENTARMHHRSKVNRRLVVAPIAEAGARTMTRHEALGVMIEHRRVDALGDALRPAWLAAALEDA